MKPKKSLGQHFLKDQKVLQQIVRAADLKEDENVLEIGPGEGALTNYLVDSDTKLILVEKDKTLADKLARNFQFSIHNFQSISNDQNYNFQNKSGVISGDILGINLPELIKDNDFQDYKVVANIPYYITGKIIRLLFETEYSPKLIVLLVQKEVAQRICAKPGEMSILAVSVQHFGTPEIIDVVSKESFEPVPKVDSAILKIVPFDKQIELKEQSKEIFRIVKIGFASPRKTLLNNLSAGLKISKAELEEKIIQLPLDLKARAEDLTVEQWKRLAELINADRD